MVRSSALLPAVPRARRATRPPPRACPFLAGMGCKTRAESLIGQGQLKKHERATLKLQSVCHDYQEIRAFNKRV